MPESCAAVSEEARNSASLILQRLASVGQKVAGDAIGKSETWVSRWKSEDAETCARLLAALGLKVVPQQHKCFSKAHIDHLHYFARIGMAQEAAPVLEWGDE